MSISNLNWATAVAFEGVGNLMVILTPAKIGSKIVIPGFCKHVVSAQLVLEDRSTQPDMAH